MTALFLAIGAVVAAAGSLVFIMRARGSAPDGVSDGDRRRAIRLVLITYELLAVAALAVALAVGDHSLLVMAIVLVLLASTALLAFWSERAQ